MSTLKVSSKGHVIPQKAIHHAVAARAGDEVGSTAGRGTVKVRRAMRKADALAGALRGLALRLLNWKRLRGEVARQVAKDAAEKR